ncbi:MAG: coproporphyrinogen III oxidase family protein [Rickettsiales bacterium]|jgi:oxygen-independent coproporphyrinogen-3 oxidase|nr:coproporphyrinogen III oxidase family protein [Rickettsiales bacterium]
MTKFPSHHLYIHTPFCAKKCPYCAFYSVATKPDWDEYAAGIIKAIGEQPKCAVPTIFFGGGTPSLMPPMVLERILSAIHKHFNVDPNAEITIEINPGTLKVPFAGEGVDGVAGRGSGKLTDYKALGINRVSIGAQSFNDRDLQFLGRIHTAAEARQTIEAAQNLDFKVSADFIYALPGQTLTDIADLCAEIKKIGLKHASLYELTIEPGTPFATKFPPKGGGAQGAGWFDPDNRTDFFTEIGKHLRRYEVSNYAEPGFECQHNSGIWAGEPYIGLGAYAAGRLFDGNQWSEQLSGVLTPLSTRARAIEKVITGLRTIRGVELTNDVREILNFDYINANPSYFCHIPSATLTLTPQGLIILDFLLPYVIKS